MSRRRRMSRRKSSRLFRRTVMKGRVRKGGFRL